MMRKHTIAMLAMLACIFAGVDTGAAQSSAGGRGTVFVPGLMAVGPGSLGPVGFRRLCDLRAVGLVQWRTSYIERVIKPVGAQKTALADLETASGKAADIMAPDCRRIRPQTSVAELEMMDKRLATLAQAFSAVKPAFEAFYASLDDRQKAKLDELGPRRHGWRW